MARGYSRCRLLLRSAWMKQMEETLLLPHSIELVGEVYRDRNRTIHRFLTHFDGFTKEYFVSDYGERAALVAVREDHVLLTRQYRLIINRISCEIPGGRIDPGETPKAAAVRECLEEAGILCSGLQPLIAYHAGLDIWKNYTRVYYAEVCQEVSVDRADQRVWMPLEQCIEMVFTGQIVDSLCIGALLAFYAQKVREKL